MKTVSKILLLAIAYLVVFLLGATSGLIHPMCYAYIGAILPFLFAFIYLHTAMEIRSFGAATVLNGFMLVVAWITGEADFSFVLGIIIISAFSEIIRLIYGYDTLKGVRVSFVPLAFSFFAYTAHWWTDTEGSLAAAVEEMPTGYDELMKPVIENIPALIFVLILTIPISILAIRLAIRTTKKCDLL